MRADPQINGFLSPTLLEMWGISRQPGIATHIAIEVSSPADSAVAPLSINSAGTHPVQV